MHTVSCIKVVQEAMNMVGKSQKEIDSILEKFVDSFANNLDVEKISGLFKVDNNRIKKYLISEFNKEQNWTEKMAGQQRKNGVVMNESIYNLHIKNEELYSKVAKMINQKMITRENENEIDIHKYDRKVENKIITETDIGKATINTTTQEKNKAGKQVQQDMQKVQENVKDL